MFKQRLLTTLLLVPLVLLGIYYANLTAISTIAVLLLLACGYEWQQLIPLNRDVSSQIAFMAALLIAMVLTQYLFQYWLPAGLFVWALIAIAIIRFPHSQSWWGYRITLTCAALLLLPLFAQSLIQIFQLNHGKAFFVTLLLLVWCADTGGYLAGKLCGQHRLIPQVSPGKTVEGIIGGLLLTLVVGYSSATYFRLEGHPLMLWLALALFIFILALIGDLLISMLKRRVQIKDTGAIFPGHGGVLDRLDSLIAASPAFYFGLIWIGQGT